jgi:3-deoxy-D-manno-octulosonic acid kinase
LNINVETTKSSILLVPSETVAAAKAVNNDWFNPEFWASRQGVVGQSTGRNTTWFIRPQEVIQPDCEVQGDWVLRHYYRGGMVAKISRDKFLYSAIQRTRPYKELKLLLEMQQLGLPVPQGIAARVVKHGLSYSADLLMQKLTADDLVKCLTDGQLSQAQWHSVGKTIANFHRHGVYHADLNAHNIMLDRQFAELNKTDMQQAEQINKVWIIDFDRCQFNKPQPSWQQQNLNRLLRSFEKEKRLNAALQFDQQCWQWLTTSYQQHLSANNSNI